uniref:Uncharacterized protein n=1 Tax=Lactuca sativa TaxID=4236 RepID=A0A9R1WJF4_LACSA|nr:hypothetical protein LSAT_V11C100016330 [Lactuca sativa]
MMNMCLLIKLKLKTKPEQVKQQTQKQGNMPKGQLVGPIMIWRITIQNVSFIEYNNVLNRNVFLPCRTTISKRATDYFLEEKAKLFKFFSIPLSNVNLTTDSWTNLCQRSSYVVVTTHFIDEEWAVHKRIINF